LKGSGRGLIEVYYPVIYLQDLKKPRETSVRRAGVPAEMRTKYHPNTSLEHYMYTNLFGGSVLRPSKGQLGNYYEQL
jgi:hypothetical protein